jgi:lysophospholipase L1-like esterase
MMKWKKQGIFKEMKSKTVYRIPSLLPSVRVKWILLLMFAVLAVFTGLAIKTFPISKQGGDPDEELRPRAELTNDVEVQISFVIDSLCRITDYGSSLDSFLEELEMLLAGKDTVIQIVHLGDSHVQAGFYTGQVMRMLQQAFGNAGRGWIAPLKLAKINEPRDYYITSPGVKEWIAGRCIQPVPKCIWGLGGLGIQTASKTVDFHVSVTPVNGAGYEFNQALLFRDDKAIPLLAEETDSITVQTAWGTDVGLPHITVDTFRIDTEINALHLRSVSSLDMQEHFDPEILQTPNCYYGFSLMNGNPGILYHSIGQNGAMFAHYTSRAYVRQLALLQPSLLIITLGTNESFASQSFVETKFVSQADEFIRLVKEYLPATAILLTTPAECFRRTRNGYVRNTNISLIAKEITDYAKQEGLACFDLYGMTGGDNSCKMWQDAGLLGRDRIHFSVDGYLEQGKLLYKALIRLKLNQLESWQPSNDDISAGADL